MLDYSVAVALEAQLSDRRGAVAYLKARIFMAIWYQPMNWLAIPIKPRCGFILQDLSIVAKLELCILHATREARRAGKITAGGATPGSMASGYRSTEGAAERVECLCHPVGVGVLLPTVSRGFTPACGLVSPSGFRFFSYMNYHELVHKFVINSVYGSPLV